MRRRSLAVVAVLAMLAGTAAACSSKGSGNGGKKPIVVGSTLSLTGAFAATGIIHKIAGQEFIARLNRSGGLLGRPVKWDLLDDQSDQSKVGPLYEKLITQDKVDLIIGPFATPNILSAMAVAERHNYVLPQHTAVLAPQMTYDCQFPGFSIGTRPNSVIPNELFDAVASLPTPPRRIAILTNQNGSTAFVTEGYGNDHTGMTSVAKQRGLDVVLDVKYPPTTSDWTPIASQVRAAHPDLVINDGTGIDPVNLLQAMKQLNYRPPMMFSLFPAPGPLLGLGATAEGLLSVSIFEPNRPTLAKMGPDVTNIVNDFKARATAAKVPYTVFETQAAASWNAWQILTDAVKGAGTTDQKAMCDYLHKSGADTTFSGHLTFDTKDHNFWPTTLAIKQIQNKDWVTVWPTDRAAAKLQGPAAGS